MAARLSRGKANARKLAQARILLQADETPGGPGRTDADIATALDTSPRTLERVRQRFVEQGLESAMLPKPTKRIYARVLDGRRAAYLIALARSEPPKGKKRWTPRLLAGRMVAWEHVDSLSHEAVRQALKKPRSGRT